MHPAANVPLKVCPLVMAVAVQDVVPPLPTVSDREEVAEEIPDPLAVMVMLWPVTVAAELDAVSVMLPELPVPGWLIVEVTPLGSVPRANVTLPVKLLRLIVTLIVCDEPPGVNVADEGLTLLMLIPEVLVLPTVSEIVKLPVAPEL